MARAVPNPHAGGPDTVPDAAARAEYMQRLIALGYRGQDLANIIAPGRTRRQIADDLIVMQRQAPKA